MKLGVFTVLLGKLSFEDMLTRVADAGLEAIELGTGAYPGSDHVDVQALLDDAAKADVFRQQIEASRSAPCPVTEIHSTRTRPSRRTTTRYSATP